MINVVLWLWLAAEIAAAIGLMIGGSLLIDRSWNITGGVIAVVGGIWLLINVVLTTWRVFLFILAKIVATTRLAWTGVNPTQVAADADYREATALLDVEMAGWDNFAANDYESGDGQQRAFDRENFRRVKVADVLDKLAWDSARRQRFYARFVLTWKD